MKKEIIEALEELKKEKRIFVSEKDFQLELAWKLKEIFERKKEKINIKLEFCIEIKNEKPMYIDILVNYKNKWYPIELKYKTKKYYDDSSEDESIKLKNQEARDQGRYDFLWDIKRLEKIKNIKEKNFAEGFAIFLTNDLNYLNGGSNCKDEDFRLYNREIDTKMELKWKNNPSKGTIGKRTEKIKFDNIVKIKWDEYYNFNKENGKFMILIVKR